MEDFHTFLERLKAALPLSSVIGRFVKIKRHGHEFQACCPFHEEKTPSFTINDRKNFYHCFGCGEHGDHIRFLQQYQNLPFKEAMQQLADMAGMRVPSFHAHHDGAHAPEEGAPHAALYTALEHVTHIFQKQLHEDVGAFHYLNARDFTSKDIQKYRIGFAPKSFDLLNACDVNVTDGHGVVRTPQDLYKKGRFGFSLYDLVQVGLVIAVDDDTHSPKKRYYNRFRERIMIPICDRKGRVIAFGGRILPGSSASTQAHVAKYINSPETPLFHKSSVLYGVHHVHFRGEKKPLIVMEGYFDVIRAQKVGINAVAPLGTALTDQHIQTLWKLSYHPVLCFDGDAAGQKAALRAMIHAFPLLKPGYELQFMTLPEGEDPDSFIRTKGGDAFSHMQSHTMVEAFCQAYAQHEQTAHTPESKARVKKDFLNHIDTITDVDIKSFYKDAFFEAIHKHRMAKKQASLSAHSKKWIPAPVHTPPQDTATVHGPLCEKILLVTLLNHPTLIETWGEQLLALPFHIQHAEDIIYTMFMHHDTNHDLQFQGGADTLQKNLKSDATLLDLAPFAHQDTSDEQANIGLLHIWDDSMRRIFLEKALLEQREKLKSGWNIKNWQILKNIQEELDTFFNQLLSQTGDV